MIWAVMGNTNPAPLVAAYLFGAGVTDRVMYACSCGRYDGSCKVPPVM